MLRMGGRPGAVVWRTTVTIWCTRASPSGVARKPGAYRQATHAVADDERGLTGGPVTRRNGGFHGDGA